MAQKIKDIIGESDLDHSAFKVHRGMMNLIKELFIKELGWKRVPRRSRRRKWGEILFVHPKNNPKGLLQFSEIYDVGADNLHVVHPGIKVGDVQLAARTIADWFEMKGYETEIDEEAPHLIFLKIPQVFGQRIELVEVH